MYLHRSYISDGQETTYKKKKLGQVCFMLHSETCQVLRNKNKRAVSLMKVGVKWVYELEKKQTWPKCRHNYFYSLTFFVKESETWPFLHC